jgi:predicted flavoprotein YhiN
MLGTDIRGIMAEEEEVQRRQEALKSLMTMRARQLRESLEDRIKRARNSGDWIQLSKAECASLHKQEKAHLQSQLEQLQFEQTRTRGKLTALKRSVSVPRKLPPNEGVGDRLRRL